MDINALQLEDLLEHVRDAEKTLLNRKTGKVLLREAFAEAPVLFHLFDWMQKTARSKKGKKGGYKQELLRMERDFLLLLALWAMQKERESMPRLKVVGDDGERFRRN